MARFPRWKEKDALKIHRCIQEGRKRKNVGTLSFCTGLDCWGNAWLAASNWIEDDGHCDDMVVASTAVVFRLVETVDGDWTTSLTGMCDCYSLRWCCVNVDCLRVQSRVRWRDEGGSLEQRRAQHSKSSVLPTSGVLYSPVI